MLGRLTVLRPAMSSFAAGQPPPISRLPALTCLTDMPSPMCWTRWCITGGTRTVTCIWIATGDIRIPTPASAEISVIHGPATLTTTGAVQLRSPESTL